MDFSIESLIPVEELRSAPDHVFAVAEKYGKAVLLRDNKPAYIVLKYNASNNEYSEAIKTNESNLTLQEAMRLVLSEAANKTMHASKLADEIYNRKLYKQKNGDKAHYNQIRARAGHYSEMFEALTGNYIKLKDGVE